MAAADPVTPDRHRFSIRLPRPLWMGVPALALIVVEVGVRFAFPIWQKQGALRVVVKMFAAVRHWRKVRRLEQNEPLRFNPLSLGIIVAFFLALLAHAAAQQPTPYAPQTLST